MATHWNDEPPTGLREQVRSWADNVAADSSPLYRRLGHAAANDGLAIDLMTAAAPRQPAPLLFLGAVHYLLGAQPEHELARWYPTISGGVVPDADPAPALAAFVADNAEQIRALVATRSVQTNEVGRCALLLPAFHAVASITDEPLAVIEIGCSAGLNLRFDDYRYLYRTPDGRPMVTGNPDSDVELECALTGRTPTFGKDPGITLRIGLDLNPLSVTDPEDVAWIRALVWPDQPHRHTRLARALERAAADPPSLIAGDALVELEPLVATLPSEVAVCIVHTHVMNQLPAERRDDFDRTVSEISIRRPIYRIASEWLTAPTPLLELTAYHDGSRDVRLLGRAGKHGEWLDWQSPD